VLDKALGDDRRHHLGGVVLPPAAIEAQSEREGVGEAAKRDARRQGLSRTGAPALAASR
jgi:hypothetical protein